jgi:hypothetical protein
MRIRNLYLISIFLTLSCATRQFGQTREVSADLSVTFESNDLSVLYPPGGLSDPTIKGADLVGRRILANVLGIDLQLDPLDPLSLPVSSSQSQNQMKKFFEASFWPNVISTSEMGGFLDQNDWESILAQSPKDIQGAGNLDTVGGDEGPFVLEALTLNRWFELFFRKNKIKLDVREPDRWKVVSMRFDPCPYGTKRRSFAELETLPQNCIPELRVVAQPIVGINAAESSLGSGLPGTGFISEDSQKFLQSNPISKWLPTTSLPIGDLVPANPVHKGWYFGDYALHLFSRLSAEQANAFLQGLAHLKSESGFCATDQFSLSVNPCLLRQWISLGAKPIDFGLSDLEKKVLPLQWTQPESLQKAQKSNYAKKLNSLWKSQWQKPYKVAFFTSTNNNDPWIFSIYERSKQGKLEAAHIKQLETKEIRGNETGMMKNYKSGRVQIVPRGASVKSADFKSTAYRPRLFPQTKRSADSLDIFMRTRGSFQNQNLYEENLNRSRQSAAGLDNIEVTGDRASDLLQMTARIENPFLNDEFSTDCASCHMSAQESKEVGPAFEIDDTVRRNPGYTSIQESHGGKNWDPKVQRFLFRDGFGQHSQPSSRMQTVDSFSTDSFFAFNQFSIYRETPIVSNRVANETAVAVWLTNKFYGGQNQQRNCQTQAMVACLQRAAWVDKMPKLWMFSGEHEKMCRKSFCSN